MQTIKKNDSTQMNIMNK